jgi:hypothetical protein
MTTSRDSREGTSLYWKGGLILIAVCLSYWILIWWQRPPVVEFDNLKYIQLLRTAVSSERSDLVAKVGQAIDKRMDEGQMSESERAHFARIIAMADAKQWDAANRACFQFEEAQLNRRRALPETTHDHAHDHVH